MALNPLAPMRRFLAELRVKRADPQQGGLFRFFGHSVAGVHVNFEMAEQVAAVWACMDVIASALSSSDWNVYGGARGGDKKESLPDDQLQYILNTRFNQEMTAQAGKRAMMLNAVGQGTGYAEIEWDMAGRIVNLWPINTKRVDPRRDLETGRLFYRVMQEYGGGWVDMDPDRLFIIRGASLLGFAGDDPIGKAIRTIATAIAMDQYAGSYFGNNAQLGTVFTYKGRLDDTHYEQMKTSLEERHKGAKNAFRSAFLDGAGDWSVTTVGSDAEKAQMVEAKQLSVEEICRWFRVPPHKIAHLLRATNNNIEHQGLEFSRDTLRPWVKEIEQEADYKLVPYRAKKFVEIDVDWAEQGDYKSRAEAYQIYRNMGVFSGNDVLRKLGENTIGTPGDIRIVQGANVRLEDVGAAYDQAALPAPGGNDSPPPDDEGPQARLAAFYGEAKGRFIRNRRKYGERMAIEEFESNVHANMKLVAGLPVDRLEQAKQLSTDVVAGTITPEDAAATVFERETA